MKARTYDVQEAANLLPFLKSVATELDERRLALRRIEMRLRATDLDADHRVNLEAERANHKKEVRLSLDELSRLGCEIESKSPLRLLIPGPGGFETAFLWDATRPDDLHAPLAQTDSAA